MFHDFSIKYYERESKKLEKLDLDNLYEETNKCVDEEFQRRGSEETNHFELIALENAPFTRFKTIRIGDIFFHKKEQMFYVASCHKQYKTSKGINGFGFFRFNTPFYSESEAKQFVFLKKIKDDFEENSLYVGNIYIHDYYINELVMYVLSHYKLIGNNNTFEKIRFNNIYTSAYFYAFNQMNIVIPIDNYQSYVPTTFNPITLDVGKYSVYDCKNGFTIVNSYLTFDKYSKEFLNTIQSGSILTLEKNDFYSKLNDVTTKIFEKEDFVLLEKLLTVVNNYGHLEFVSLNTGKRIDGSIVNELYDYNFKIHVDDIDFTSEKYKKEVLKVI